MPETWRIQMFGGLTATRDDDVITEFAHRKVAALLAYLARDPQQSHSREELAHEFWPGRDPAQSQSSLSNSLSLLRKQLERPTDPRGSMIQASARMIGLNASAFTTDLADFEQCLRTFAAADTREARKKCMDQARELYRGDMLPELAQDWVQSERVRLARSYVRALLSVASECDKAGDTLCAVEYASMATRSHLRHNKVRGELYDLHIMAHEYLMRLALRADDVEQARAHWKEVRELSKEVGMTLSTEGDRLWENVDRYGYVDPSLLALPSPDADIRQLPILEHRGLRATQRIYGRELVARQVLELLFGAWDSQARRSPPLPFKHHLVTIVGPSGYGKTRLAQAVCHAISDGTVSYPDLKSWFVPMAHVRDAVQIAGVVADALSVLRSPGVRPRDQVRQALGSGPQTLLLLDGLPDLPGTAEAVAELFDGLTQVACLVTAQSELKLPGEKVVPLPPLALPEAEGRAGDAGSNPCVRLFEAHACAVRPGFAITEDNAQHVARLCRLLRGIPLAIVIAAARSASFTPAEIHKNLLHDRDVWSDAVQGEELVSRTLYWTYRLLSPALQDFFVRLSVFRGGWTVEAARAVCGHGRDEPLAESYLGELSRCRLIEAEAEDEATEGRFFLLEEPERLARQRIGASQEDVSSRHAEYFLSLVKRTRRIGPVADLDTPLKAAALRRYALEHENLNAALGWCLNREHPAAKEEKSPAVTGVALAAYLWGFWNQRNLYREGLDWLSKALETGTPVNAERLELFNGAGVLAMNLQEDALAHRWLTSGWQAAESLGKKIDSRSPARLANSIAYWHERRSRQPGEANPEAAVEAAGQWYWRAARLYGGAGGQAAGQTWSYHGLGKLMKNKAMQYRREADEAVDVAARKVCRKRARHCFTHAARHFERSLAVAQRHRDDQGQSHVLQSLATLLWSADRKRVGNDNPLATILLEQCLHIRHALLDLNGLAAAVEIYGNFAHDQANYRLSAALDGIARAMRAAVGTPPHARTSLEMKARQDETKARLLEARESYQQIADRASDGYNRDHIPYLFHLLDEPWWR